MIFYIYMCHILYLYLIQFNKNTHSPSIQNIQVPLLQIFGEFFTCSFIVLYL